MFEIIQDQMSNEFLSGGLVLMILGTILAYGRVLPLKLWVFVRRRIITTVDILDDDEAFFWMTKWLAQHRYTTETSRLLTVSTKQGVDSNAPKMVNGDGCYVSIPEIIFSPAPGRHLLKFERHWLLLDRQRRNVDHNGSQGHRETFTLHTFCRDRSMIRRLIYTAQKAAFPPGSTDITICAPHYETWAVIGNRPPRPPNSVVLDKGVMANLESLIDEFLESRDWYISKGIPYQIGFLFHGPPGNGKTSTALALASQFKCSIYLAKLTGIGDQSLRKLFSAIPAGAIVLIEDVDSIFSPISSSEGDVGGNKVVSSDIFNTLTFSGFLNAMDGIMGADGRILIMTTNHKDQLNPALIRKGRIDHEILFDNATAHQAECMFLKFFPGKDPMMFAVSGEGLPMTELQGALIEHRDDPVAAARALLKLKVAA